MDSPLADRIRPADISEIIGQAHLLGPGKPLAKALAGGQPSSMIFWGPPGCGKTTLARLFASRSERRYYELSAVSAGKGDIRAIVTQLDDSAQPLFAEQGDERRPPGALLFLDEIHRFNKAQQDYLLPFVEDGRLTLIGATTENPSFEVIAPLLSRCQVYVLQALTEAELWAIIARGEATLGLKLEGAARDFLARFANGDARRALNLLEATARLYDGEVTRERLQDTLQSPHLRYDKAAEEHYDTISAFIKSMRASDADAALYYLARMVAAGEDPKFIARRMVIFASEDIGLAQPTALVMANAVFRAVETIGYPEAQINLAHGAAFLARARKDRSSCDAYFRALEDARQRGNLSIPMHLRNAPTQLMRELGYGQREQESNLPAELAGRDYFTGD
ncbi:MAG: replication-associated recombination protein A [Anaerolineaceae bacterium]|nr:replication-associated recombination protein A [Anaerolineaceae bacterium]